MDKTIHRATRGHPLSIKENRWNKAISRTQSLVERPFAVLKRTFEAGHLMVTTVARVRVKTPSPVWISIPGNSSLFKRKLPSGSSQEGRTQGKTEQMRGERNGLIIILIYMSD